MALIALEGMKFYAFHGVYEAERVLGNDYVVDVIVETGIAAPSASDSIADAIINYEPVFQICLVEMSKPRNLLEAVVGSIIRNMKIQFPFMKSVRVRVRKMNPPVYGRLMQEGKTAHAVPGQAGSAWVEDEVNLVSKCPRCKLDFLCYKDDTCWCRTLSVHPATLENLKRQFGTTCLCSDCMKLYKG